MGTTRYYVGHREGRMELFTATATPTQASHGHRYAAVTGPFRTKRAAVSMVLHGAGNPHCQCVYDAERLAGAA